MITPDEVELQPDFSYNEELVKVLAREVKELWNKRVLSMKNLRNRHGTRETMWEMKESMKSYYPNLFTG